MTRDEQATVNAIKQMLDKQEAHRKELRTQDDHWRDRMEAKTDKMFEKLDDLSSCVGDMPEMMDEKVERIAETLRKEMKPAVELATNRNAVYRFITDWRTVLGGMVALFAILIELAR